MKNELFERELQNTSINDVSLADYVKENYLPISVLDKIRDEILNFKEKCNASDYLGCGILEIIDKYKAESEEEE